MTSTARWLVFLLALGCDGDGGVRPDGGVNPDPDAADPDSAMPDAPPDGSVLPPGAPPVGVCRHEWCWVFPLPQGNGLTAIWGAAADDVWVAGGQALLHYDGITWTDYTPSDPGLGTKALWGASSTDIWAGGTTGIFHWDGAAWTKTPTTGVTSVSVLGGTSPTDVWADCVEHWDGSGWTSQLAPAPQWETIAIGGSGGSGESICVSSQGAIAKWLGSTWGIADAGSRPTNAAVAIDETHVVIAQDFSVQFWDGSAWTINTPPVSARWTEIAATSVDDVWVTGHNFDMVGQADLHRYHWDGATWTPAEDPGDTGQPQALWQDPAKQPWVVMQDAEVRAWNGTEWTAKTFGDNYVQIAWGTDEDDIWTISVVPFADTPFRNRALHWDGASWSEAAFPFDRTYRFGRMWGSAPDDYWIAAGKRVSGGDFERYMIHWDGTSWSEVGPLGLESSASAAGFVAVWGSSATDVYAVSRTSVFHYDGATWSRIEDVTGGGRDVFGSGANDVYVIGSTGTELWHWNGTAWSPKTTPHSIQIGWANSPSDIWLSGGSQTSYYDGTFFVAVPGGGGIPLGSANEMFVIGSAGIVKWPMGFSGPNMVVGGAFFTPFGGAWRLPSGRIYAAGNGLLVH